MHWWQTPFSSSSSSSSNKHHSGDNTAINKLFSISDRAFRAQKRRLTRARRLRYIKDVDIPDPHRRFCRYSSSHDKSPVPLPLPELACLLRRDASSSATNNSASTAAHIPLPSPPSKGGEERERGGGLTADAKRDEASPTSGIASRFACHDCQKNKELEDAQRSRKAPQELDGAKRFQDSYAINLHTSAPTSPYSTPELSPYRIGGDIFTSQYMFPQAFQVWSAPEMPPLDMNLGLGFSNQMPEEKIAFSVDNSPPQSPRVSPQWSSRSPNGPSSPLNKKLTLDIASARRDSNAQANIHPLPLPPGATSPSQQTAVPQLIAKAEITPVKPQWLKGKLIGRGTFGSVYVASNR